MTRRSTRYKPEDIEEVVNWLVREADTSSHKHRMTKLQGHRIKIPAMELRQNTAKLYDKYQREYGVAVAPPQGTAPGPLVQE